MTGPAIPVGRSPVALGPLPVFGLPGLMARQDFRGQLAFCLTVQAVLLLVAISIDLSRYFDQVAAPAAGLGLLDRLLHLGWYLGLRIVDMVTRLLPIAVFVGVLAFELRSILTRRRAIHWISGRHPMRILGPAAAVGLALAPVQYLLETQWRPQAVLTQAAAGLGIYGEQFQRFRPKAPVWFLAGDDIVHAGVRFGPPAALVDVDLYRLDEAGRVGEVIRAPLAEPGETPEIWRFHDAVQWTRSPGGAMTMRVDPLARDRLLPLPLHPLAVTYMGVPAKYIPDVDLREIVASGSTMLIGAEHLVWLQERPANSLMPLAMALLAASVSLFAGATRPSISVLIGCGLAGYSLHVGIRVFIAAGELQILSPAVSVWAPVLTALAAVPLATGVAALRHWRA